MTPWLDVEGLRGPSGEKYVKVTMADVSACLAVNRLAMDERGARAALARQGVTIIGAAKWRKLLDRISEIRDYADAPVIEKIGWNGLCFALPDGTIYPKSARSSASISIEADHRKCARSGTFKRWRDHVARPLEGQHFSTFILMTIFAPPLLALSERIGNFGFEIVGAKGTGKSTLQYVVSSAVGGAGQGPVGHYWITLATTVNALEDTLRLHADLPVLMDEANLLAADASTKERAAAFKALVFTMGSGAGKDRLGVRAGADYRCIYVTSSNEPLVSLLGQSNSSAKAAADRLITLPLEEDRPFGVFDTLPDDYGSASEFAEALMRAADLNHGHAMRRFIKKLVNARNKDESRLRSEIRAYVHGFRKAAGVDTNKGSDVRVSDAFGLVYAAGKLARRFGVLPKRLKPAVAALRCYKLHLAHSEQAPAPFAERLRGFTSNDRIGRLKGKVPVSKGFWGYIKKRGSHLELIVPPKTIAKLIPDWARIKKSPEVRRFLKTDGNHQTVKRRLRGEPERVYCFSLPPGRPIENE